LNKKCRLKAKDIKRRRPSDQAVCLLCFFSWANNLADADRPEARGESWVYSHLLFFLANGFCYRLPHLLPLKFLSLLPLSIARSSLLFQIILFSQPRTNKICLSIYMGVSHGVTMSHP
jgi:hypothetical protein